MTGAPKHAFTSARHEQRRALHRACREVVKGTDWRSAKGVLFTEREGWFLAAQEMTSVVRQETNVRLVVKPMAVDPIFWNLIGETQLRSQSLSFRYFGALTCPGLILGEPEIGEEGGPHAIAARMLAIANVNFADVATSWTTDRFLEEIAASINPSRLFATAVAALIASNRAAEALALCESAVALRQVRGFMSGRGSFPEVAAEWIQANSVPN